MCNWMAPLVLCHSFTFSSLLNINYKIHKITLCFLHHRRHHLSLLACDHFTAAAVAPSKWAAPLVSACNHDRLCGAGGKLLCVWAWFFSMTHPPSTRHDYWITTKLENYKNHVVSSTSSSSGNSTLLYPSGGRVCSSAWLRNCGSDVTMLQHRYASLASVGRCWCSCGVLLYSKRECCCIRRSTDRRVCLFHVRYSSSFSCSHTPLFFMFFIVVVVVIV